jgi:hypothetical protein
MKSFNSVLAVVCGVVVVGFAATLGRWAHQFQKMYAELDVKLTANASTLVNAPFSAYLGLGLLLGLGVAWLIWVIQPRWLSLPIAGGVLVSIAVGLLLFCMALMAPVDAMLLRMGYDF